MKKLLLLIAFVTVITLDAGYYGNVQIDTYDPISGKYYKAIIIKQDRKGFLGSSKGSSESVSNIAIFDPKTNSHKMLFEKNSKRDINVFIFETGHQHSAIQFNGEESRYGSNRANVKNNRSIAKRKLRNKLLIGTRDNKKRITELWTAKKDGNGLSKIAKLSFNSSWHIDIKNSKLRVVTVNNGDFKIESLDW